MSGRHSSNRKDHEERKNKMSSSRAKQSSNTVTKMELSSPHRKRHDSISSVDSASNVANLPKKRIEDTDQKQNKKKLVDYRLSTAAQFFIEETVQEEITTETIVQLLRDAVESKEGQSSLKYLENVKELLIKREPKLLDNFLDEVVSFQHDQNPKVRIFVVKFIEEACKKSIQILPKVIGNLILLLSDAAVCVQKAVVQTTAKLYTITIKWLCNSKNIDEVMEATWASMLQLKSMILSFLDSDNEGLRLLTIKFIEIIVITQTSKDQHSPDDLSLDTIPVILKIFRPKKMEEEAKDLFQKIVDCHCASHVSSLCLMACMQVLTSIGKKRFEFFGKALLAFESLHANLPPTLSQTQVSSVRKSLKLQLFSLTKHPNAFQFQSHISILLSDLGATPQQITRCFPSSASKKHSIPKDVEEVKEKKIKLDDKPLQSHHNSLQQKNSTKATAIDITSSDIILKLTTRNVADLALVSMLNLPHVLPAHFQSTYTPIAAAGTEPQVKHLARLLATQMTIAGLGKGVEETMGKDDFRDMEFSDEEDDGGVKKIQTVVGQTIDSKPKKQPIVLMPSGGTPTKPSKYSKRLDFQSVAKPLSAEESNRFCMAAYNRILDAEKIVSKRGGTAIRTKILTTLASQFRGDMAISLKDHILENPRNRLDLAFHWIYQEYSLYRGFESAIERPIEMYEETINRLLSGILDNEELHHVLFSRFFVDPPCITEGMTDCLRVICTDPTTTDAGLQLAKSMSILRPSSQLLFLGVICDLTLHENNEIRTKAVEAGEEIYNSTDMKSFIEVFALRSLKFLLNETPTSSNFAFLSHPPEVWTEDLTKICLHLYLALLPVNHRMIHDLGTIYVETSADVKRTILRALEAPVKGMSMASPELLCFVEKCPKGAETLVTRIIHILTDKAPPSAELVDRVRDLYRKRVQDVRFLIPIINGLTKREVIAALPELIKLNPTVVKEVFHRLLGSSFSSPLSPAELLVALHNIDSEKCNLKTVIKATSLCFEEKNVYTQVVLAMVMQQLMEQDPLPILLMRTVIQSLANYPHLLGFVTNILQRLIIKEVWKQKRIWEGFIKCCQRTKPQSFQVLLQLPAPQLNEILVSCPDLRDPLCQYVETFTEHQKSHIAQDLMEVISSFNKKEDSQPQIESDKLSEELNESSNEPLPSGQDPL